MVRFNLTTRIHDPGAYTIKLKIFNRKHEGETPIAEDEYHLLLEEGQKQQRVVIEIPNAKLWSPEDPHQYRLRAQLVDAKGHTAEIETHFGLRKIEARGYHIYLNQKKIYLDGILYQPGKATYEEIKLHIRVLSAASGLRL